jgi:hypothetical protein
VKSILGIVLPVSLGVGTILAQISPTTLVLLPEPSNAKSVCATLPSPADPVLRYVPGSSVKVEQLLGEEDKQLHQPTLSQTATRYGIEGTDLGSSFESAGRVFFLFGDTVGRLRRALDTIGTTDATDPESGVRLDFLESASGYLTIEPPGISMGPFEVPVAGISLGGQVYVVVSTNHSEDRSTDRSVLTKFTPPANFQPLRTISQLPKGHFVKMSMHIEPGTIAGLPPGGPFVLVWGTGAYRMNSEDLPQLRLHDLSKMTTSAATSTARALTPTAHGFRKLRRRGLYAFSLHERKWKEDRALPRGAVVWNVLVIQTCRCGRMGSQ